jgi:hypothetical protein
MPVWFPVFPIPTSLSRIWNIPPIPPSQQCKTVRKQKFNSKTTRSTAASICSIITTPRNMQECDGAQGKIISHSEPAVSRLAVAATRTHRDKAAIAIRAVPPAQSLVLQVLSHMLRRNHQPHFTETLGSRSRQGCRSLQPVQSPAQLRNRQGQQGT